MASIIEYHTRRENIAQLCTILVSHSFRNCHVHHYLLLKTILDFLKMSFIVGKNKGLGKQKKKEETEMKMKK